MEAIMRYQVIETKVYIVESSTEDFARMTVEALQDEMQMTEHTIEEARHGNCSEYGKIIDMAESTNIFVA